MGSAVITLAREPFSPQMSAEMLPLAQKCWEESTATKLKTCAFYGERDFNVDPDMGTYQSLSDQGKMILITVRVDGALKGYLLGFSYYSLHHQTVLCAMGDSIYIEPRYRSHTREVVTMFEKACMDMKIQVIGWPVTLDGPVYQFLKARDYVADDVVMEKRLTCAL